MIDNLSSIALKATTDAAIACFNWVGKEDKISADKAATEAMRRVLSESEILGRVVIGEGERDEAPMLYLHEKLGKGGEKIDIAVDPLENTNACVANLDGAVTVIALAPQGSLLSANDIYMNKIATALSLPEGLLDLDYSIEENLNNLASYLKIPVSEIGVSVLNRPRHNDLVNSLRNIDVNVNLIEDGDITAILQTTDYSNNGLHLYMGIGGAPEGVLAASALKALNGFMQTRLIKHDHVKNSPDLDFNKKYSINDMVSRDAIFCLTAITNGLLKGIEKDDNYLTLNSVIMNSGDKSLHYIKSKISL